MRVTPACRRSASWLWAGLLAVGGSTSCQHGGYLCAEAPCPDAGPPADAGSVDAGGGADVGPSPAVCARQHDEALAGATIVVCDEAFGAPPFVHLPADSSSGDVETVYGGIGATATGAGLLGRGRELPGAAAWVDAEAASGALRYAYFLYRATVRAGAVERVTPVVRIDDRVFARLLGGLVFEGGASARSVDPTTGEIRFAFDDLTTPMRLRFDVAPSDVATDSRVGFPRFALVGHVENFGTAVTASDGTCLAALTSLGDANPFFGLDGAVTLLRYPGMHAPFDDVFTLALDDSGNVNMGEGIFLSPAELIQDVAPTLIDATNGPHGTPWAGPSAALASVDATTGGATCTP